MRLWFCISRSDHKVLFKIFAVQYKKLRLLKTLLEKNKMLEGTDVFFF